MHASCAVQLRPYEWRNFVIVGGIYRESVFCKQLSEEVKRHSGWFDRIALFSSETTVCSMMSELYGVT